MVENVDRRIAELEAQIEALCIQLRALKRTRAGRAGGKKSGIIRRDITASRNAQIKARLRDGRDDLYRRGGGLIRRLASEFGVSERLVGKLHAEVKAESNDSNLV